MKTLLLLRHAKSSHDHPGLSDHDRPLNERGRHDAPKVGEFLVEHKIVPDLIICSDAVRTCETASLVAKLCGYSQKKIKTYQELYLAPPDSYVAVVSRLADDLKTVVVVGHNPGMEDWASRLAGEPLRFPTAAIVEFVLDIAHWKEFPKLRRAELKSHWRPKDGD